MFLYFRMFLIMGVTLYTSRIVLKALGVEDFGLYNVVGGIVTMFSFINHSLGAATSRYITFELGKKDYTRLNRIFNVALAAHIVIALIIILLAETIGLWFFYEKMEIPESRLNAAFWVYQISILTSFFAMTQVPYNAVIIARENMKIFAFIGIVEVMIKLLIVFLLTYSPIDKLIYYAMLLCTLQISILFFYRYYCIRNYRECKLKIYKDRVLFKTIFIYGASDMIGQMSVLAQGQGLNLLLNVYFGPVVNAARAIAYQVQGAVNNFSSNFMTAVKPQIIKSYAEGNLQEMWVLVVQSSCFSFYLLWMICLPLCLEAETILELWLGNYPEHSTSFLILILIHCLIQSLKTPRTTVFHALAKILASNVTVGLVLCLAFPLAYTFLELGGSPESVFWAANITIAASEIVSVLVLKRFLDFSIAKYFLSVHCRCIMVVFVSISIPYILHDRIFEAGILRLLSTCLISFVSVALTSFYLGMDRNMRMKISKIIKKRINYRR